MLPTSQRRRLLGELFDSQSGLVELLRPPRGDGDLVQLEQQVHALRVPDLLGMAHPPARQGLGLGVGEYAQAAAAGGDTRPRGERRLARQRGVMGDLGGDALVGIG